MRTNLLFPLTAIAVVAGGCRSEAPPRAARAAERDLTLVAQTAEVRVASAVETQQIQSPNRGVRPARRAARPVTRSVKPTIYLAAAQPANDRELLPGKTVTLIPAGTGPSSGTDEVNEATPRKGRTMVVRGGGTCRGGGRRPGIGIARASTGF